MNNYNCKYFILWYLYKSKNGYLIWFSSDGKDGVFSQEKRIPTFSNITKLSYFSKINNIYINESDLVAYNLDLISNINSREMNYKFYSELLSCWNLFTDISNSIYKETFFKHIYNNVVMKYKNHKRAYKYVFKLYDKLFFANNLPSITPIGKCYIPIWSKSEIKMLKKIMYLGIKIFENNIIEI